MKFAIIALLATSLSAANYSLQQSYLLSAGVSAINVTDAAGGTVTPVVVCPGAARARVTFSENGVPPAGSKFRPGGSTTYSALGGNPAAVTVFRNWGDVSYWAECVDVNGARLSPSQESNELLLPMIESTCPASNAAYLPVEVVGQRGDIACRTVNVPVSPGTGNSLYIKIQNAGYKAKTPVDQKAEVQINGGSWITISTANTTAIDEPAPFYGGVGSAWPVREFLISLADGTVLSGDNVVKFRSNHYGSDGVSSGFRIVNFNFVKTTAVTLSNSLSVTSNVATATVSSSANLAPEVILSRGPDIYAAFSGNHQITVTDGMHFTFVTCENHTGEISPGACTTPNGTYSIPTAQYPDAGGSQAQPTMVVRRALIPYSTFLHDDPSAWIAPSGGNAVTGATIFASQALVSQGNPSKNFETTGTCLGCHFKSGKDLAILAFSNQSIEQRCIFHGCSWQDAKDVAAYIRSLYTAASWVRAYNPPLQPGPGLDTLTPEQWIAGAGVGAICNYDSCMARYLCPAGDCSSMGPTSQLNMRELPIYTSFPTWDQWLPPIFPGDFNFLQVDAPTSGQACLSFSPSCILRNWPGSIIGSCRDLAFSTITPGNVASYKSFTCGGVGGDFMKGFRNDMKQGFLDGNNRFKITPLATTGPGTVRPNDYNLAMYSTALLGNVNILDVNLTLGFVDKCNDIYTSEYGTSTYGYYSKGRCFYQAGSVFTGDIHYQEFVGGQIQDQTDTTKDMLSNMFYLVAGVMNPGNRRAEELAPFDVSYYSLFIGKMAAGGENDVNIGRPAYYLSFLPHALSLQQGIDWALPQDGSGYGWIQGFAAANVSMLSSYYSQRSGFASLTEQTLLLTQWTKNITAGLTRYTPTQLCTYLVFVAAPCTSVPTATDIAATYGLGQADGNFYQAFFAGILPALSDATNGFGVNSGVVDAFQAALEAVYPATNWATHRASTFTSWTGKPGIGATVPTMPKYSNCPGCSN